jgi:hypothetical protein
MRTLLSALAALVLLIIIAWAGLWFYAENRLQTGVKTYFAQTNNAQMQVSYDGISGSSSPFVVSVVVTGVHITFGQNLRTGPVTINAPSFGYHISIFQPSLLHIDLPPQITGTSGKGDAAITFGSTDATATLDLGAAFSGTSNPITGGDWTIRDISVLASSGSLKVLHIDQIYVHEVLNRTAGAGQTAVSIQENFDNLALSPLFTQIAHIPFNGTLSHLGLGVTLSGPVPPDWAAQIKAYKANAGADPSANVKIMEQVGHEWATAGGSGSFTLNAVVGPTTANLGGTLKFDSAQQPQGTADLSANHLDALSSAILDAYPQTQDSINQAQAHLSPYLSTTDADGQVLTMHLTYGNGAINLNGQQVAPLPPLNWNYTPPPRPAPVSQ